MTMIFILIISGLMGFRPLSRGLFSIGPPFPDKGGERNHVFVPSLGDFFSIMLMFAGMLMGASISSPFSGTFFQSHDFLFVSFKFKFSSPFSGTFFQLGLFLVHLSTKIGHETKKIRHKN